MEPECNLYIGNASQNASDYGSPETYPFANVESFMLAVLGKGALGRDWEWIAPLNQRALIAHSGNSNHDRAMAILRLFCAEQRLPAPKKFELNHEKQIALVLGEKNQWNKYTAEQQILKKFNAPCELIVYLDKLYDTDELDGQSDINQTIIQIYQQSFHSFKSAMQETANCHPRISNCSDESNIEIEGFTSTSCEDGMPSPLDPSCEDEMPSQAVEDPQEDLPFPLEMSGQDNTPLLSAKWRPNPLSFDDSSNNLDLFEAFPITIKPSMFDEPKGKHDQTNNCVIS